MVETTKGKSKEGLEVSRLSSTENKGVVKAKNLMNGICELLCEKVDRMVIDGERRVAVKQWLREKLIE